MLAGIKKKLLHEDEWLEIGELLGKLKRKGIMMCKKYVWIHSIPANSKNSKKNCYLLKFLVLMSSGYVFDGIGCFDRFKLDEFLLIKILIVILLEKCGGTGKNWKIHEQVICSFFNVYCILVRRILICWSLLSVLQENLFCFILAVWVSPGSTWM